MKKMMLISLLYCFSVAPAWGEDTSLPDEFERHYSYQERKIIVKSATKVNEPAFLIISVYQGSKMLLQRERSGVGEGVRRVKFAPPYLFLFWGAGIHGEAVSVLDVDKERVVWEKSSSWPMSFLIQEDRVEIRYKGDRISVKPEKYEKFSKIFRTNSASSKRGRD